jgi:hypothetical protein
MKRVSFAVVVAAVGLPLLAAVETAAAKPAAAKPVATVADRPIPCPAFARDGDGGWKVLQPVMLTIDGTLVSFTVGTRFGQGTTKYGIAMPTILDRECGNRRDERAEVPGPTAR